MRLLAALVCAALAAAADAAGGGNATKCATNGDCSLNGLCVEGVCVCDPGWAGLACGVLQLVPPAAIMPAYPPPELRNTTSSWGGSILQLTHTHAASRTHSRGMRVRLRTSGRVSGLAAGGVVLQESGE